MYTFAQDYRDPVDHAHLAVAGRECSLSGVQEPGGRSSGAKAGPDAQRGKDALYIWTPTGVGHMKRSALPWVDPVPVWVGDGGTDSRIWSTSDFG